MDKNYLLSIAILTMNRCVKVTQAIESCLDSSLPDSCQFVIIDNGSTDQTEVEVRKILDTSSYDYLYKKLEKNIGVAPGRNLAFDLVSGKYVYFMDDDAIINPECRDSFFKNSIDFFENNHSVCSITTKIIDPFSDRIPLCSKNSTINSYPEIFKFSGGSHFLRTSSFKKPLYQANIRYGSEELEPSLQAVEVGYRHVWLKSISVIHNPINKWKRGSDSLRNILINSFANDFALKRNLYPFFFSFLIDLALYVRIFKHISHRWNIQKSILLVSKQRYLEFEFLKTKKISFPTVIKLFIKYGFSIF